MPDPIAPPPPAVDPPAATIITPNPPNAPTVGARPYWMPDTRGFLAFSIVSMVSFIVIILLMRPVTMDERVSNLLSGVLGILVGCFKDVFSFSFNSTQASEDKSKTIDGMTKSLANSVPAPLVGAVVPPSTIIVPPGASP